MGTWPYEASSAGVTSSISISFKFDLIEMKSKDLFESIGGMPLPGAGSESASLAAVSHGKSGCRSRTRTYDPLIKSWRESCS